MKDEYIKYIINEMCKFYGYGVIAVEDVFTLQSNWALVRNITYSQKRVVVFTETNINADNLSLMSYLKSELNCENVEIIKISLVGAEEKDFEIIYNEFESNNVIIDYMNNIILKYSENIQDFVQELASIMYRKQQTGIRNTNSNDNFRPWVTYGIIGINIIAYIITSLLSRNFLSSDIDVLIFLGAKYNPYIKAGEYYRLITCMFLHGGIIHLALNMYALYSVGPLVEKIYKRTKYIIIYFISGILSSLFSFMFSEGVSIGASGAIFGLLGTVLVFAIQMKKRVGKSFLRNIASVIVTNLIVGLSISNIDNFGHLGGLLGGALLGFLLYKNR